MRYFLFERKDGELGRLQAYNNITIPRKSGNMRLSTFDVALLG